MDRSELINDYVNHNVQTQTKYDTNLSYLENLKYRLTGCTSITEIKEELNRFLDNNQIQGEIRENLTRIAKDFDENTDLYNAQRYLENYLSELVDKNKKELDKSEEDVNDIKQSVIDQARKDLEDVGVRLVGDEEDVFDDIKDLDDVEKIQKEVEVVKAQRENEVRDLDAQPTEVEIGEIKNVVENSGNQNLANAVEVNQVELDSNSPIQDRGDGTIEIKGDANNDESMNFMAMMTTALVASDIGNDLSMNLDLDMRMMKDVTDVYQYKAIFGNFPVSKMTDDKKLSSEVIADIQKLGAEYNPSKDYIAVLNQSSPELAEAFQLVDDNLLKQEGAFQFLVKNDGTSCEMMFALDEHYNAVSEAFQDNGAMVSNDVNENNIVRVPNGMDQLFTLQNTNAELKQNSLENTQNVLENGVAMVKKYEPPKPEEELDEAANISPVLLVVVTVVEMLLIGVFIFLIMNK